MFSLLATWGRNRFARNTLHEVKPMPCIVIGDPLPPPEPDHAPFLLSRKAFKVLLPTQRDEHGRYRWVPATFAPEPISRSFPS